MIVELRFTQAARKHGVGKARVREVVAATTPSPTVSRQGDAALEWRGADSTGRVLPIVAVVLEASDDPLHPTKALVIHVMPTY